MFNHSIPIMNSSFYIFGRFNGKEEQYPIDYTKELFQSLLQRHHYTHSQLVIHRDGKLMYYCYMRKLEQENYLGFCLLLNDAMITEFTALFELFDHAVTQLALNGEIIKISDQGEIVSNTDSLLANQQAIKQTASSLTTQLSPLVATKKTLPAQTYSSSQDDTKTFMLNANASWIAESSLTNAYTIITKEDNSSNLDSYQQTIKRLQKEKEALISGKKNNQSKIEISKSTLIIALIVGVLLAGYFVVNEHNKGKVHATDSAAQIEEATAKKDEQQTIPQSKSWSASFSGEMAGFPMKLKLIVDDKQQISGSYRNIKYGTALILAGRVNPDGTLSIQASNQSEQVIFELSLDGDRLIGYGNNGKNHLDVHLTKEKYSKQTLAELTTIVHLWNDKHVLDAKKIGELKSLFADQVHFYGEYLSAQTCVNKIIATVEKLDGYSQSLIGEIEYTKQTDGSFRCDFTKRVFTNGKSKDYPAYLILNKQHGQWVIITESDLQTDAYFERLKRKKR